MGRLDRRVYVPAAAVLVLLMALSTRYGYHRDELYFLDCARHLQAGYVDQPVFTPLLAWFSLHLFGPSLVALHVWVALAAAVTVLIGALLARELGGGPRAQLFAAIATAAMPVLLAVGHLFGPTAFDIPAWAALVLVALRAERTGDPRWWPVGGVVLGAGLTNKHSIGFLAVALTAGALISGGRRLILNRWFLLGALIAAVFTVPDVWWQAAHGWPAIAMTHALNQENGGAGNVLSWIFGQLIMVVITLVWLWVTGLRHLWRSRQPIQRGIVWAFVILFVFFAVTAGAKIYYEAGLYIPLLAAGAVAVEPRPAHWWRRGILIGVALAAGLPLVLPVLPPARIGWTYGINQTLAETTGWPQLARSVRDVWTSLPPASRTHAVIFTSNYGEAGAIDRYDRHAGLPAAVSGHNSFWFWGPGDPDATTVIAVMPGPVDGTGFDVRLRRYFSDVRPAATLSNPYGLHNQEWGGHVYVCTGPLQPWGTTWPLLRHYD